MCLCVWCVKQQLNKSKTEAMNLKERASGEGDMEGIRISKGKGENNVIIYFNFKFKKRGHDIGTGGEN